MGTARNSFSGRIYPQGVGRWVPRCCAATLSLATSQARSLLADQLDMSRHSLRGSLRCPRDTVGRSPLVREREAAGLPAPYASVSIPHPACWIVDCLLLVHRRVQPAIPQNEFLEVS